MQNQTQDFYEIYDYYTQPLLEKTSVQISLITIAIIAIVSLTVFFIMLRRRKIALTFWEIALRDLAQLKPEKCSDKNDFKNFYFKLTNIFKKYLDIRYDWQTITKTDEELIKHLANQNFNQEMLTQIQKILEGALWVKFANQDALKLQAEADLKIITQIIERTRPTDQK